jgi:hypothetical protein
VKLKHCRLHYLSIPPRPKGLQHQHYKSWAFQASSPEMRTVILQTYLDNYKNNSKHAFSNACPLERYMHNSSCTMETNWWKYLLENDVLLTPHQNINPLILWTTGTTILYPKYLTSALNQVWNEGYF